MCPTPALLAAAFRAPVPQTPPPSEHLVERDAFGEFALVERSDHFAVKRGEEVSVAEEAVEALLAALETAWEDEVEAHGYPPPLGSDAFFFNVYVGGTGDPAPGDLGAEGYFNVDADGYPYVVLSVATVSDAAEAEPVSAHEFFHAVQHGTGSFRSREDALWFWEATSEWIEGQVWPDTEDQAEYLGAYAMQPHLALDTWDFPDTGAIVEYHAYGAFLFVQYLSEFEGESDAIRDTWVEGGEDGVPLEELDEQVGTGGTAYRFRKMAAQTVEWSNWAHGDLYEAAADASREQWPEDDRRVAVTLGPSGSDGWEEVPADVTPERFGYNLIHVPAPAEGVWEVEAEWDIAGSAGSVSDWRFERIVGTEDGRDGTVSEGILSEIEVDSGSELWLVAAAVPAAAEPGETFGYRYRMEWTDELPETLGPHECPSDGCCCSAIGDSSSFSPGRSFLLLPLAAVVLGLRRRAA